MLTLGVACMHSGGCQQHCFPRELFCGTNVQMHKNQNTYYSRISKQGNEKILSYRSLVFVDSTIFKDLPSKVKGLDRPCANLKVGLTRGG